MGLDSSENRKKPSQPKKFYLDSLSSQDGSDEEQTNKKRPRSPKSSAKANNINSVTIFDIMKPSEEEMEYRKGRLKENVVDKLSKFFKCTKCHFNFKPIIDRHEKVSVHPFLKVLMCKKCCDYYGDGDFSLDSDEEDKYCRWCGEGGTIFSCSKCICGFCASCIKKHLGFEYYKKVQDDDDWECFFCNPKPLWEKRFICSLAVQLASNKNGRQCSMSPTSTKNDVEDMSSMFSDTISQGKQDNIQTSPKSNLKAAENNNSIQKNKTRDQQGEVSQEQKEPQNAQKKRKSILKKKSEKRRRVLSSSSDESEHETPKSPKKQLRFSSGSDMDVSSSFSNDRMEIVDKLGNIVKLAEHQFSFGVNWSTKICTKLAMPKERTKENVKNECQKVKLVLSLLSTRLAELSNAVESIEKSLPREESATTNNVVPEDDQSSYNAILQFLGFMSNQVKVFKEKGISLKEVIESEIYEDPNVIGIKKRGKANETKHLEDRKNLGRSPKKFGKATEEKDNVEEVKSSQEDDKSSRDGDTSELVVDIDSETDASEKGERGDAGCDSGSKDSGVKSQSEDLRKILAILEHA